MLYFSHKTYRKNCKYCDPIKAHQLHLYERLEMIFSYFSPPFIWLGNRLEKKFPRILHIFSNVVLLGTINLLFTTRILTEVDISEDETSISNRTLVFIKAMKQRGVDTKRLKFLFKKNTNIFYLIINGKKKIFDILPHSDLNSVMGVKIDDKEKFKELLRANQFPHAYGRSFNSVRKALCFAKREGFPLIVKPRSSSLSKHVTCNINNFESLKRGMKIAKIIDRNFIVEKHVDGQVYRITLVGGKFVACCLKEQPNVVGDGIHTVKELVEQKNSNVLRGEMQEKNYTLRKIQITENSQSLLSSQNHSLTSIPEDGERVYLHDKVILSCGADIHDKTDSIHPDNKAMFERIAELCKSLIIGLDFICPDISISYKKQVCAVIEANSLPYIDMHHYPVSGEPRDVGGALAEYCLTFWKKE